VAILVADGFEQMKMAWVPYWFNVFKTLTSFRCLLKRWAKIENKFRISQLQIVTPSINHSKQFNFLKKPNQKRE
jgi:hypothetical protein